MEESSSAHGPGRFGQERVRCARIRTVFVYNLPPEPAADPLVPSDAQASAPVDTTTPMRSMPDFARSRAETVAELLRSYNLAEHTPMEAMLFISELKRLLNER